MHRTIGYQLHPGMCMACGSADGTRQVIDFDCDDWGHAKRYHVYACAACIKAAYDMLDDDKVFVDKVELARLRDEVAALTSEVLRMRTEAEAWDQRIALIVKDTADA